MDINSIANAFAEAAIDSSKWHTAMEHAAVLTESFGAALFPIEGHLPTIPFSQSLGNSVEHYLREEWFNRDERYRAYHAVKSKGVGTDADFITPDAMDRHPYYQDFLGKHNLKWFAGVNMASGSDRWCLSLNRSPSQGAFAGEDLIKLASLSAALGGPVAVACSFGFAKMEAALSAFETSGTAAVMFDRHGLVSRLNGSAENLLGTEIQIKSRKLVSSNRDSNIELDKGLKRILWDSSPRVSLPPIRLSQGTKLPISIYLLRLPNVTSDIFGACRAIGILQDYGRHRTISSTDLKTIFGLTNAECNVAIELCDSQSLENIAVKAGVSYETVRNQLKSIFIKTGVKRQPELVSLLTRGQTPIT